jgi:hypothetical protein
MDGRTPPLSMIQRRLEELVVQRLVGLTPAEQSEYAELVHLERHALADRRSGSLHPWNVMPGT